MSLNLKDEETVALVSELAKRLGKTKTGAVREVVRDRLNELDRESESEADARVEEFTSWLERDIWPHTRSRKALTKEEEEELLGYDEMLPL
ncbi:MAG: antitoxin VapB [Actinomycetota bacterium]|jgi:antitoxin VapB|nr:antitoxin VapB [Actinomycetota bacterium]